MSGSLNLTIPERCAYQKFFLVEEISLLPHPESAHYGKLKMIGRLQRDPSSRELKLYSLSYKLTTSTSSNTVHFKDHSFFVKLECSSGINFVENDGKTIQISGELYFIKNGDQERNLRSAADLIRYLRQKQIQWQTEKGRTPREPTTLFDEVINLRDKIQHLKLADEIKKTYSPVIKVHQMMEISHAKELILAQLRLRTV